MTDQTKRPAGPPRPAQAKPTRPKAAAFETLPGAMKTRPQEPLRLAHHRMHGHHTHKDPNKA